jgi:hypothetical protein
VARGLIARLKADADRELRYLQIAIAMAALVPVCAGLAGVLGGLGLFGPDAPGVSLDSHFRYLSGLLFGIGLAFWFVVPTIATSTGPARLLTFIVVVGGLARLVSLLLFGSLTMTVLLSLAMELVVTPGLCFWQARVARAST